MPLFSSFKRKGGGVLTQKVTADLAKQSVTGGTELGSTVLLNVRSGATVAGNNGAPAVAFSTATYQAHDPCGDALILEVCLSTGAL